MWQWNFLGVGNGSCCDRQGHMLKYLECHSGVLCGLLQTFSANCQEDNESNFGKIPANPQHSHWQVSRRTLSVAWQYTLNLITGFHCQSKQRVVIMCSIIWTSIITNCGIVTSYRWFSARFHFLNCWHTGDTALSHQYKVPLVLIIINAGNGLVPWLPQSHHLNQTWGGGWGCEVSCGGHHRPRGKTTTGSAMEQCLTSLKYWPI